MTYYQKLINDPGAFSAKSREQMLENVKSIAAQPGHRLYAKAVAIKAALEAAEHLVPNKADGVMDHGLLWDKVDQRNRCYRGFLDGRLVVKVVRIGVGEFGIEVGGVYSFSVYPTIRSARAAAAKSIFAGEISDAALACAA